jgi:outer membrane receptor for ferrienterochelin and colicin
LNKLIDVTSNFFCFGFFLVFECISLRAQTTEHSTISGFVRETGSRESLIGVNIYLPDYKTGTVTNNYGFYSITLPASDSAVLIISYVGFTHEEIKLPLRRDIELNIDLNPGLILDEVTVSADRPEKQSESVKMSTVELQSVQIKNVPSLLGEKDVLKVLQLMPGVQKGSEGSSGLYVRGGGPDQNLIILDDATVYNASHLFGFFSLFNGDALKSIELTKGGFPARYGGRLSSVLEMNMKEGNKEDWHGEGGIGLISSRMTVEGPIKKGISSILLSGRRTYADLLLRPVMAATQDENTGYYFYDFNAKINWDFGRKNKLYLSGYFGKDKYYQKNTSENVKENVGFLWGNETGTFRWNHLFNNKLFANASVIFSNYEFRLFDRYRVAEENKDYYAEYNSGIRDLSIKYDIDYIPGPDHWIKIGAIGIFHRFKPHAFVELDNPNNINIRDISYTDGIESGIYAEDTWQPFQNLKINWGLRFSHFLASKNQYHYLEPRLSAAWRLKNDFAVKASYSVMNQYIHMLSGTGISLPTDLWVPTTDRVKPQRSQQLAIGMAKDLRKHELTYSLEGYYKKMNSIIEYKEGASFLQLDEASSANGVNWEDNVTSGQAWSYGIEFLLQKKTGRLTGWIGYTLSWTMMQFDSLNLGNKFYARYDRRHDISIAASYKMNNHITLSGTWVYGTGNAITLPMSQYLISPHNITGADPYGDYNFYNGKRISAFDQVINDYGEKNNFRMRAYHRLDLGIQFHKKKKWGERIWEISVYNLYNRRNPFYYYTVQKTDANTGKMFGSLKQVSLFPVIPSFTYSFKF